MRQRCTGAALVYSREKAGKHFAPHSHGCSIVKASHWTQIFAGPHEDTSHRLNQTSRYRRRLQAYPVTPVGAPFIHGALEYGRLLTCQAQTMTVQVAETSSVGCRQMGRDLAKHTKLCNTPVVIAFLTVLNPYPEED